MAGRPLLELLLAPMMSNLMFTEVVECVLAENWHRVERSLDDLQGCCAQLKGELDDLIEAHRRESVKSSQRRIKKEMDLRRKTSNASVLPSPSTNSALEGSRTNRRRPPRVMMIRLTMVPGMLPTLRWLLPPWPMTLHQGAPQLNPLFPLQLKNKPMPWRWMTWMVTHPQLALSPLGRTIY